MSDIGMLRVAAGSPKIKVADVNFNKTEILKVAKEADSNGAAFLLLPELTITGCTVGDLFLQPFLCEKQIDALFDIAEETKNLNIVIILGCYVPLNNRFFNCAAILQKGTVKGIIPKTFVSDTHEKRWFEAGKNASSHTTSVILCGKEIPFGNIIFTDPLSDVSISAEVCSDLWSPINQSSLLASAGAQIIFNCSSSEETAGQAAERRNAIQYKSKIDCCGYVYASSGIGESSTDVVFSGHRLVAECGDLLSESDRFERNSTITYADIDIDRIKSAGLRQTETASCLKGYIEGFAFQTITLETVKMLSNTDVLIRKYQKNPSLPEDKSAAFEYCRDIFNIQAAGLAKRMEHIGLKKTLLGISGGLDSTLALLVCAEAHKLLGLPTSNIITITMPGFGTTDHTHDNAISMMKALGTDLREISIKQSVLQHFQEIGHDEKIRDLTYENAQARERTQILMDVAGKEGALMVGTGDLSELALGWCTYNGDHMSMYGVNGGITKTMIPHVLNYVMETRYADMPELKATIQSVIDTPISPELLPPSEDGDITQKTEDHVGPYVLHDFFIYHTLITGMNPAKLFFIAEQTFKEEFNRETIKKWQLAFYKRFFSQQFKRSCSPDCPKTMAISLSPREDFLMPSDAVSSLWIGETEKL